jgi:succinate-acetate transporter protein
MLTSCHLQDPNTVRAHFHARGRADTPFYVVSQVQSCNMSPLGLWGFGLTTALLQVRPCIQSTCGARPAVT